MFILDEASVISHLAMETIDRCIRDLTGLCDIRVDSKTFGLGGDFKKTLPIIPRGHNMGVAN